MADLKNTDFVPVSGVTLMHAVSSRQIHDTKIRGLYVSRETNDWVAVLCDECFIVHCDEDENRPYQYALRLPDGSFSIRGNTFAGGGGWAPIEWLDKAGVVSGTARYSVFAADYLIHRTRLDELERVGEDVDNKREGLLAEHKRNIASIHRLEQSELYGAEQAERNRAGREGVV